MSGSRPTPAEQHLGDRLAALVDGELGHDTRERVLAHLATCAKCKAEADAQRRLKTFFADTAPPPPSEGLLARLQGLPEGGPDGGSPFGGDEMLPVSADRFFGMPGEGTFRYAPAGGAGGLLPGGDSGRGFRIHDVGRGAAERSASRGRRFAFAAAGAVSLAAIALGGVSTGLPSDTGDIRGSKAAPQRTQGGGGTAAGDTQRRRGSGQLATAQTGQARTLAAPAATPSVSAPLLPGVPQRERTLQEARAQGMPASPLLSGAGATSALSPLIRPVSESAEQPPVRGPVERGPAQGLDPRSGLDSASGVWAGASAAPTASSGPSVSSAR
ncbi:zf-HC2 domain-containing protein [Streptomyces triticagri]|uniref:Zf-HC2 domain-containing protein n=1 Tax=Streptomyces triticagri TaxID=2293568 RepID=A0A372MCV7_9ACTN|nr:zf-HC2 domain-containing protein [Streptomyces triticagri]RFU88410.1 zf-HC2 domain-containing protein [Streptomyces triticagri]